MSQKQAKKKRKLVQMRGALPKVGAVPDMNKDELMERPLPLPPTATGEAQAMYITVPEVIWTRFKTALNQFHKAEDRAEAERSLNAVLQDACQSAFNYGAGIGADLTRRMIDAERKANASGLVGPDGKPIIQ